ncbi:hypothetical protein NKI41_00280 [Mesorhizobium sp. M0601]|uniref:hypothetical protein n=1 Tax=Mesorhizobium sp. M0601 TaxID=2956969 RepID=UPI00333C14C2
MDTVSIDIVYRPLRIAFAIRSDDLANFQHAARLCFAFWGGRFNPILLVDRPEAKQQIEVFRPDIVVPLGNHADVAAFVAAYPHWKSPFFPETLFVGESPHEVRSQVLDIQNLLHHWRDNPIWKDVLQNGIRIAHWQPNDPLADALLCQFGAYPDPAVLGINYETILTQAANPTVIDIPAGGAVPVELLDHPNISSLSRFALEPHHSSPSGNWQYPGIYAGDGSDVDDLTNFWNLRACGIQLMFFDIRFPDRFMAYRQSYEEMLRADLAALDEWRRRPAIWSKDIVHDQASELFGNDYTYCRIGDGLWNGLNVRPSTMHFKEESSLGVLVEGTEAPRVSFALREKPFSTDSWFYSQHAVASIGFRVYRGQWDQFVFIPPYLPELNEFAGRAIRFSHRDVRLEPEHLGLIIGVTDNNLDLTAIPATALINKMFSLAGISAKPSGSGLITRQLMARMGGPDGTRAFKIPGVRRLLKTYGPTESFSRSGALQLIGQRDPASGASFKDHEYLFIEPRPTKTVLTASMVFSHLVEKGLFRIGADLKCPTCSLTSWTALDQLQQQLTCSLCGAQFDATRQLVETQHTYRRSGVLGLEKNTQGAVPVALVLQQLAVNISGLRADSIYAPSFDLEPIASGSLPVCETDLVVITKQTRSEKPCIIIGECKDRGGAISEDDVNNLRQVADAFPRNRVDVYILLAKLGPFDEREIELAKSLNARFERRVIMLTDRELEPYHIYERTNKELNLNLHGVSAKELASATHHVYFQQHQLQAEQVAEAAPTTKQVAETVAKHVLETAPSADNPPTEPA